MTLAECMQRFVGHTVKSQRTVIEAHTGVPLTDEWLQQFFARRNERLTQDITANPAATANRTLARIAERHAAEAERIRAQRPTPAAPSHIITRPATRLGRLAMLQMRRDHGIRRFILHPPDCHFDKTILHRAATTNAKIITAVGLRLCQRTWLAHGATIDDHFMPQLPSNLHPLTRHLCLRGGAGQFVQSWPSVTYEVYPDRIVGRSFHRHPVMVEVPDDYAWPDTGTVDDRFIASLGYRWEDYDNLTDSSQGYIVELCDVAPDLGPLIPVDQAPSAIDDFSRSQHVTDLHRQFYQIPFTWHTL
jgi:hypothetical protein